MTGWVGRLKMTVGGWQMESDMRGLADGKCQEGVGRWKVTGGGWQMESDRRGLADGK